MLHAAKAAIDLLGALGVILAMIALIVSYRELTAARRAVDIAEATLRPEFMLEATEIKTDDGHPRMTLRLINLSGNSVKVATGLTGYVIVDVAPSRIVGLPIRSLDYWIRVSPQAGEIARWEKDTTWLEYAERDYNAQGDSLPTYVEGAALVWVSFVDPLGIGRRRYFGVRDGWRGTNRELSNPGEVPVQDLTEGQFKECQSYVAATGVGYVWKPTPLRGGPVSRAQAVSRRTELNRIRAVVEEMRKAAKSLPPVLPDCPTLLASTSFG